MKAFCFICGRYDECKTMLLTVESFSGSCSEVANVCQDCQGKEENQ